MVGVRSSLAAAVIVLTAFAMASPAAAAPPADPLGPLAGTWGLAPVDRQPGVSGSYLAIYQGDEGKTYADRAVNAVGWRCSAGTWEVSWNAQKSRFEWPNESEKGKLSPCWMTATPKGAKLDLTIWCPYSCTDGVHTVTIERIASERLVPPVDTVHTFCSTHDALRQQFCLPGAVQDAVARLHHAAKQRSVLSDEDEEVPDTEELMLQVLEGCHARGGDRGCLLRELEGRAKQVETAVASRQDSLAKERRASETASGTVVRPEQRKTWEGKWSLVNDLMVGTLTIAGCNESGCKVSIDGGTNYQWGASSRSGGCEFEEKEMRFVDPRKGFVYLEPYEDDANAEDAGPFANFCRLDLERLDDGVRVRVRGTGCQRRCMSADSRGLTGDYHPIQEPSFPCQLHEDGGIEMSAAWEEALFCLDPELARLDRELASAFEKAKGAATGPSREKLVRAQRAWLGSRREECDHGERRTCLVAACRKRLEELQAP